jgi:uncharacterized membrane protein
MMLHADWIEWLFFFSAVISTAYASYHAYQARRDERRRIHNSYLEIISKGEIERTTWMVYAQTTLLIGGIVGLWMQPPGPSENIEISDQGVILRLFVLAANAMICWKLHKGKIMRQAALAEARRKDEQARFKLRRTTD